VADTIAREAHRISAICNKVVGGKAPKAAADESLKEGLTACF
jgi:hypothetical protein